MENRAQDAPVRERLRLYHLGSIFEKLKRGELNHLSLSQGRTRQGLSLSLIGMLLRKVPELNLFVKFAKDNESVTSVVLDISNRFVDIDEASQIGYQEFYNRWEEVAQGLSCLKGLRELRIDTTDRRPGGGNSPDYRALALILRRLPQVQTLIFSCALAGGHSWPNELGHHPNLQKIRFERAADFTAMKRCCDGLVNIPTLSCVEFGVMTTTRRHLPVSFDSLVAMPSLTKLSLQKCHLTLRNCQRISEHLEHSNSQLELLDLEHCHMASSGLATILRALQHHSKIKMVRLSLASLDETLASRAMGDLLSTNRSLEELRLTGASFLDSDNDDDVPDADSNCLNPLFAALQSDSTLLKVLTMGSVQNWPRELAREFRHVLESPTCSVEEMSLHGRGNAYAWPELIPSFGFNRSLKKLNIMGGIDRQGAIEIATQLANNNQLDEVSIIIVAGQETEGFEDMDDAARHASDFTKARFVESLGNNTTLRSVDIRLPFCWERVDASDRGIEELMSAFRKNYGIHQFDGGINDPEVEMICDLNTAGRRYLADDPSSVSHGVQVLNAVSSNLNAIFFHLSENPALCEFDS